MNPSTFQLPPALRVRVPAKINLFLHVTGRRPDGYHLLESIFCPIDCQDHLTLQLRTQAGVQLSGGVPGVPTEQDLSVRAAQAFFAAARVPWGVDIRLHKHIPTGAGLGGGSADAAWTLLGLNHLLGQPLRDGQLASLAVQLGADVPFFLLGQPAFVSGIGETVVPIEVPRLPLVIVKPPAHIATADIFKHSDLTRSDASVRMSVFGFSDAQQRLSFVAKNTKNSLQAVAQSVCSEIATAVNLFSQAPGGQLPMWQRMTGSGSAVFAVYMSDTAAQAAARQLALQLCCHVRNASGLSGSDNSEPSFTPARYTTADKDDRQGLPAMHAQPGSHSGADESGWFVWCGSTLPSAHLKDQLVHSQ